MSVERLQPERRTQVGHEEYRGRECAIGKRELGSAREAAIGEHLLELADAILEVGHFLADYFFVARLRIHLAEQRTQRRLEVQVVEAGEDSHLGAALWAPRQQRRSRILILEVLVNYLGLGDEQTVGLERWNFAEHIDLRVFGGAELASRNRRHLDVESLLINDEPGLGGKVGEIHTI